MLTLLLINEEATTMSLRDGSCCPIEIGPLRSEKKRMLSKNQQTTAYESLPISSKQLVNRNQSRPRLCLGQISMRLCSTTACNLPIHSRLRLARAPPTQSVHAHKALLLTVRAELAQSGESNASSDTFQVFLISLSRWHKCYVC